MKKQIPILMSTMMVQAILAYRKTMTRRTSGFDKINKNPENYQFSHFEENAKGGLNAVFQDIDDSVQQSLPLFESISCPYGKPGDILWVREKWMRLINSPYGQYGYAADLKDNIDKLKWKPSIHMPKVAARIWLEVTEIRVDRLQDITKADAIAEGVEHTTRFQGRTADLYINYLENKFMFSSAGLSFSSLWISINGQDSWVSNPWVWVVSFRVLSTTGIPAGL